MGENISSINTLGRASEQQLFHLNNGPRISSVRELAVELRMMAPDIFSHHVTKEKNDFSTWVKDVFQDEELAQKLSKIDSQGKMADAISKRIVELEEKELERYGIKMPSHKILPLEEFIQKEIEKGVEPEKIRDLLIENNWKEQVVDLVLEQSSVEDFSSIEKIEDIERFFHEMEKSKSHIINAIASGSSLEDIRSLLFRQGWSDDLIDFFFFDVFKPHPSIKKLSDYIKRQLTQKNKKMKSVRETLLKLGWKEYLIDSVVYGTKEHEAKLSNILHFIKDFSADNQKKITAFLEEMGWDSKEVHEAIEQEEIRHVAGQLGKHFDFQEKLIKDASIVTPTIIKVKKQSALWRELIKEYHKINKSQLVNTRGELHIPETYETCYSAKNITKIEQFEGRSASNIHYLSQDKPLLVDLNNHYLILPEPVTRQCIATKKYYPINKLVKIEVWDKMRTHKITKYVLPEYESKVRTLLEEQTKIVQS